MPDDPAWWGGLGPEFHATIHSAERAGLMTYRDLDAVLPAGEYASAQIESVLAYVRRRGIELVGGDG